MSRGVEELVENSLKKAEMLRKSILKVAFEGRLVKMEEIQAINSNSQ